MLWFHSASKGGVNTFIMNEEFSLTEIELCIEGRPDEVILPKPIDSDFMSRASYFLFFWAKTLVFVLMIGNLMRKSITCLNI